MGAISTNMSMLNIFINPKYIDKHAKVLHKMQ